MFLVIEEPLSYSNSFPFFAEVAEELQNIWDIAKSRKSLNFPGIFGRFSSIL
jgi:hypothetical protein